MITQEEIKQQINDKMSLLEELNQKLKTKDISKAKHKHSYNKYSEDIKFLRNISEYLFLVNPKQETIEKDIEKLEAKLELIAEGYNYWFMYSSGEYPTKARNIKTYENIHNVINLKAQIKNLKFILG